jgi:hypothetical protein
MRIKALLAVAAVLTLGACAGETPYQSLATSPDPGRGGYSERQIEPGKWRVLFSGNAVTSRQTVETYLLYRAAELTVEQGYDWFSLETEETRAHPRLQTAPTPAPTAIDGAWGPHWRYRGGGWFGGWRDLAPDAAPPPRLEDQTATAYLAFADIALGHGAKPAGDPAAFDAQEVLKRLGPDVARP